MQLPYLPSQNFGFLKGVDNENELFSRLSRDANLAVEFLSLALDDNIWTGKHISIIQTLLQWLTNLFYKEQIGIEIAQEIRPIVDRNNALLAPILPYDLSLIIDNQTFKINSLLMAASSAYFNGLIRNLIERKQRELKVTCNYPSSIPTLLDFAHHGNDSITHKDQNELEELLAQARIWNFDEIAKDSEYALRQFIRTDNSIEVIKKARKNHWEDLEKIAASVYNDKQIGLKLHTLAPSVLMGEFWDLKDNPTLQAYKEICPYVSVVKFREDLPSDPDFSTVLKMTPKLKGIDLSNTTMPPIEDLSAGPENLEYLNLAETFWLNDKELVRILIQFNRLTSLNLKGCTKIGSVGWTALTYLDNLTSLDLSEIRQLTDEDLAFSALNPPPLEYLSLAGCRKLTPMIIQELARAVTRLSKLDLSKTAVDDRNLAEIGFKLTRLQELNIEGAPNISERALQALKRSRPTLTIIR